MNTVILTERKKVELTHYSLPRPRPGEVVVEVAYCGVCRTDRKCYELGQRDLRPPRVLGHEFSGRIAAVGEGVRGYRVGDAVAVHPGIGCGGCDHCRNGNDQCCDEMRIFGFHLDGGFSRYCRIPKEGVDLGVLRQLPADLPLRYAAMTEPLGCVVHMLDIMGEIKGKDVLVIGGGVLGFLMAKLLRHEGAATIVITEPNEKKRRLLAAAGFTACPPEDPAMASRTFDAVIPCAPYSECFAIGVKCLRNGGFFGYFSGLIETDAIDAKTINAIHYKELTVKGAYGCGLKDTAKALELIVNGFDLSDLPVDFITLEQVESVLKQRETADALLTMIRYEGGNE